MAGVLVGADSMSRAVAVPTYIADVIVAVALLSMLVATAMLGSYRLGRGGRRWTPPRNPPFWVAVLRIATPLVFGTLGVLLCERAGVLNLGIGASWSPAPSPAGSRVLGAGLWTGVARRGAHGRGLRLLHAADGAARAVAARRGPRHHAARDGGAYYAYRVSFPNVDLAADDPALRADGVAADPHPRSRRR